MNITDLFTNVDKVSVDEARKIIRDKGQNDLILLDVREPAEYESGHIPGAQFQPLSDLLNNLDTLDGSKTVITYCKRGPRSRSAAVLLKRNDFKDVYYMEGGIDAWNGLKASGQYDAGMFLMEGRESSDELIALAWSLEAESKFFYGQIRDLLTDSDEKNFFDTLVKAEEKHKTTIVETYRKITGDEISDEILRSKSAGGFMESGVAVNKAVAWIKDHGRTYLDMIEFAMQLEINALDLYIKIYREIKDQRAKDVFNVLIEEEKSHLKRLGERLESETINSRTQTGKQETEH